LAIRIESAVDGHAYRSHQHDRHQAVQIRTRDAAPDDSENTRLDHSNNPTNHSNAAAHTLLPFSSTASTSAAVNQVTLGRERWHRHRETPESHIGGNPHRS